MILAQDDFFMQKNESNTIRLSALHKRYINEMARLANNKNIARWVRRGFPFPYTRVDAEQFIEASKEEKNSDVYAIEWNRKFTGLISLIFNEKRTEAEVGYWVGEEYWGKGIGFGALSLAIEKGFDIKTVNVIKAEVIESNLASIRVLEKAGFTFEKTTCSTCNDFYPEDKTLVYLLNKLP